MAGGLTAIERRLLERLQRGFPLQADPYGQLAEDLDLSADEAFSLTARLCRLGVIRRLGPVLAADALGCVSTLLALEVDPEAFDQVTDFVNSFPEVTHNYQRDHQLNLWCTVLAADRDRLLQVVRLVAEQPGVRRLLELPAEQRYKLSLKFPLDDAEEADGAG